ncbi:MAG TPA: serine-type D-Ala-D-Ala carboxypeptidase, partial [Fontimonas sp.]
PVSVGQVLGSATLSVDGKVLRTVDLVALQPIEQGGFFVRLIDTIRLWLGI